jgi:sigma-B regulation protein RsbU (phosphoserine phosphatase)
MWSVLLHGSAYRGTLVNRKKSSALYTAELSIAPIKDSQGCIKHFVSVLKDVTEARNIQEQRLQLRLARDVQQRFYAEPPRVRGLDIAAAVHPAEQTGGDYFDVIPFQDDDLYVAVGDVSGHGLDSALVMTMTRAYIRSFVSLGLDPGDVLACVNRALVADLGDNRYVTVLIGRLDIRSCGFVYAGAGHVPGYVLAASGEVQEVLESTGVPLGLFRDSVFMDRELQLKPSGVLLLCTDGAEETTACDGAEFGCERILEYIRCHMNQPANQIAEGLYSATRTFAGIGCPQQDDFTLVLIKVSDTYAPYTNAGTAAA